MALQTKTITANGSKGHHKFTLNVTEESTSIANNNSPMSFSFVLSPIQAYWDWAGWGDKISYSININGNEYSGSIPNYDGVSTVTLKTGTLTIPHNDNGAKTINISFNVTDNAGQSYTPGNASESSSMVLTTIPRASSISVSNYDLGQNLNIVIGRKVDTFTSTLSYKIGNRTGVLVEKYNDKNYVWEMSEELINQIKLDNPKNRLVDAIVYCDTYDGDTQIGSQTSTTFKLTITDKPVITDVVRAELNASISALTDKVLRTISQNQFTINANAPTGTTIASYKVANGTQNSGNVTSNIVNLNDIQTFYENDGVLKTKFIVTCVDARGNISEEYPLELDFIDYVNVSINKTDVKITRTTNTSNNALLHMTGNFYNGLIGEIQNELTIQYKFRVQGVSEYSELKTVSATYENNTFKIDNLELENGINYQENYEFVFYVTDLVNDADDMTYIFTSSIPFEIHHKKGAYIKELDADKLEIAGIEFNQYLKRKIATAYFDYDQELSGIVNVNFDNILSTTEELTLSDGGIRIGKGISKVLVSANAFFVCTASSSYYLWTAIMKNGVDVSIAIDCVTNSQAFTSNAHSPKLIEVQEGDIIAFRKINSETGTFRAIEDTYLTVEIIE